MVSSLTHRTRKTCGHRCTAKGTCRSAPVTASRRRGAEEWAWPRSTEEGFAGVPGQPRHAPECKRQNKCIRCKAWTLPDVKGRRQRWTQARWRPEAVLSGRICENCGARGLQPLLFHRGTHHRALATYPRCSLPPSWPSRSRQCHSMGRQGNKLHADSTTVCLWRTWLSIPGSRAGTLVSNLEDTQGRRSSMKSWRRSSGDSRRQTETESRSPLRQRNPGKQAIHAAFHGSESTAEKVEDRGFEPLTS